MAKRDRAAIPSDSDTDAPRLRARGGSDAAESGGRAAGVECRRNKRRLTRTSVSYKADVSDRVAIVDVHELLLGYSAWDARKFGDAVSSPTLDLCRKRLL